ncbi:zinc finger BED domain-containing protein RICESLEEPER 1-like [Arachis hypogaea]|uniref:zinc finger BED domain-containing protein RICESLEEPER 1-like n=1 Tax=Arachis hypogaea TaxID=3818 RepID=UPI003B2270A6
MGVAVILDPRYKLARSEYKFSMLCQIQDECSSKIERIKQICYDLFHEYQQNLSNSSNAFEYSTQELQMNAEQDDDAAYQLYIRQKKRKNGSFVKTEFDHYIEEDVHPLSTNFDILAWWKVNGARFLTLQRIVRDIFFPVSTVTSESSFSTSS